MQAIAVRSGIASASALEPVTLPRPSPAPGQLLIQVRAAGVNRPDIFQRMGLYPPPPGAPATLGLEIAGEVVVAAGRFRVGDAVCALLPGGGYAEYAACDARHALPLPPGLTFEQAAGLPETVFTVYANVVEDGRLRPGETLLVHGATSGIGVMAIQLAKALGARVIATARGADKARFAQRLGADVAIDASSEDFAAVCSREGGADVILDMVGGAYLARNLETLRPGGRLVFIAALDGGEPPLPIMQVMRKRLTLTGSTLRSRSGDEKARLATEVERVVWPWLTSGQVGVRVDRVFPLRDAALAHTHMESGQHAGKIILHVG